MSNGSKGSIVSSNLLQHISNNTILPVLRGITKTASIPKMLFGRYSLAKAHLKPFQARHHLLRLCHHLLHLYQNLMLLLHLQCLRMVFPTAPVAVRRTWALFSTSCPKAKLSQPVSAKLIPPNRRTRTLHSVPPPPALPLDPTRKRA